MYYKDYSYKISFVLATLLHMALVIMLCIKIAAIEKQPTTQSNVSIIKAFSINQNQVAKTSATIATKQRTPQTIPQPQIQKPEQSNKQDVQKQQIEKQQLTKLQQQRELETMLKQQMLTAQAKEAQSLTKEVQMKNRELRTLQKIQENRMLHGALENELSKEGKQLQKIGRQLEASSVSTNNNVDNNLTSGEQTEVDKYKALIIQAIAQEWIVPDDVDKNTSCKLLISVGPGGVVLRIQILQPSNNPLLDRSAQNAVWKASPLPIPPNKNLFDNFRSIQLTVRPEEISQL